jgi:alpha-L-arabinofuranosidase
VFFGEYAAQSDRIASVKNRNNFECALSEAAYMTGLERNGDVVRMASYAPLFANSEAWQWTPDLIWVDSLQVARTPNYYVQQMYAVNHGDTVLPMEVSAHSSARFYASAVSDNVSGDVILKLVNAGDTAQDLQINLQGTIAVAPEAKAIVLSGDWSDENRLGQPAKVVPQEVQLNLPGAVFAYSVPAHSFTVLRLQAR